MRPGTLSRALLLSALFVVLAVSQSLAGSPAATPSYGNATPPSVTAPAAADFLATLSDLASAPGAVFATGCTSSSQCPKGQLCCLACGFDGCETRACFQPMNGHCPAFP
jgi:hypothetical protein